MARAAATRACLALATAAGVGCFSANAVGTEPSAQPDELNDRQGVSVASGSGLEQRVTLAIPMVQHGGPLRLRSVLKNRSEVPLEINARICGFDVSTDIALDRSRIAVCGGYSVIGTLSPGSSLTEVWEGGRVESPPGRYRVRVRHALEPELWTEGWITVRP